VLTRRPVLQPTEVDMLIGSMANTLNAGGGFCAGSKVVTEHQVRVCLHDLWRLAVAR
jgi:serine palmitoyltransferase